MWTTWTISPKREARKIIQPLAYGKDVDRKKKNVESTQPPRKWEREVGSLKVIWVVQNSWQLAKPVPHDHGKLLCRWMFIVYRFSCATLIPSSEYNAKQATLCLTTPRIYVPTGEPYFKSEVTTWDSYVIHPDTHCTVKMPPLKANKHWFR